MVAHPAPSRGDIIWVDLEPTKGREQRETRPALVISPKAYNDKTSLLIARPLTTKIKGYPFEVNLKHNNSTAAVLVDQIKSLDWRQRLIGNDGQVDSSVMQSVTSKLSALLVIS